MPREPIQREDAHSSEQSESITDMAVIEAMLDQLVAEQNVWEYVDKIENVYRVPADQRQHFYEKFITMVALRPQAEQDALIARGQPVFRYRSDTARRDIQALRSQGGSAIKFTPSVLDAEFMAEIIHCPNEPVSIKYLVYKRDRKSTR